MTEAEILEAIRTGKVSLPPVEFGGLEVVRNGRRAPLLKARWNGKKWRFAVEIKARSTPKTLRDALQTIRTTAYPPRTYPLVIVPYLTDEQVEELEDQRVSGVDLSGNGILVVSDELLVLRTGRPNLYPEKSVLRNVYRGKVSLAARVFLLRPRYAAVGEIRDEILARGGSLALSTVSKVLARLEEDLIVSKKRGDIRLIQPRKLLESLASQYAPPAIAARVQGKTNEEIGEFASRLSETGERLGVRFAPTGRSSALTYAVMARSEAISFYCSDIDTLVGALAPPGVFAETERFPNVRLEETRDETVYFDVQEVAGQVSASPIQTYLELMSGDKRERETAKQVAEEILNRLGMT